MNWTKSLFRFLLIAGLLLGLGNRGQAALNAVGPTDPANGFPTYYQDGFGVALVPCLDLPPAPCVLPPAGAEPNFTPLSPVVFPTNFPTEFFYWIADADPLTLPANVKVMRFALEGSFANVPPVPTNGQQVVFSRIRIRITPDANFDLNGRYTVTHPFGVNVFDPPHDPVKGINFTEDIPLPVPLDFTSVLASRIGPYLVFDPIGDAPAGYVGDFLTPHAVTGSPAGTNFVRIDGPNIGGPGVNSVETSLFLVSGKLFNGVLPAPLTVVRSTYGRTATGSEVDVFASSSPSASLLVDGGPSVSASPHPMLGDGLGRFFDHIIPVNPGALPATINVTASVAGAGSTTVVSLLTDVVTIDIAEYDADTGLFTVQATSSDETGPISLTAEGLGPLSVAAGIGSGSFTLPVAPATAGVPPAFLTVSSSKSGSATKPVKVIGTVSPPATQNLAPVITSAAITTGTIGAAYSYQVVATDPNAADIPLLTFGALSGTVPAGMTIDASGLITWTPAAAGVFGPITVTVSDPGGLTGTQTFSVTVAGLETITITRAQFLARGEWRIDGTSTNPGSQITIHLSTANGTVIGTAIADALGAWSLRQRPATVLPGNATTVVAVSNSGAQASAPIQFR